jgi:hypothetical protein
MSWSMEAFPARSAHPQHRAVYSRAARGERRQRVRQRQAPVVVTVPFQGHRVLADLEVPGRPRDQRPRAGRRRGADRVAQRDACDAQLQRQVVDVVKDGRRAAYRVLQHQHEGDPAAPALGHGPPDIRHDGADGPLLHVQPDGADADEGIGVYGHARALCDVADRADVRRMGPGRVAQRERVVLRGDVPRDG